MIGRERATELVATAELAALADKDAHRGAEKVIGRIAVAKDTMARGGAPTAAQADAICAALTWAGLHEEAMDFDDWYIGCFPDLVCRG